MDAVINALARPEWLAGAAVAVLILGLAGLIALYKPYVIPVKTHQEQLDAANARADRAEKDAEAEIVAMRAELTERMTNFRADHSVRMEQAERLFNTMLAEANRRGDDWKANAHITAENAKLTEDRMDEVVEISRLSNAVLNAIYSQVTGRPQLPGGPSHD
jgi:hypothetical protein